MIGQGLEVKKNTAIKANEFGPGHATMIARPRFLNRLNQQRRKA
jgi:hypothetical protein